MAMGTSARDRSYSGTGLEGLPGSAGRRSRYQRPALPTNQLLGRLEPVCAGSRCRDEGSKGTDSDHCALYDVRIPYVAVPDALSNALHNGPILSQNGRSTKGSCHGSYTIVRA